MNGGSTVHIHGLPLTSILSHANYLNFLDLVFVFIKLGTMDCISQDYCDDEKS